MAAGLFFVKKGYQTNKRHLKIAFLFYYTLIKRTAAAKRKETTEGYRDGKSRKEKVNERKQINLREAGLNKWRK